MYSKPSQTPRYSEHVTKAGERFRALLASEEQTVAELANALRNLGSSNVEDKVKLFRSSGFVSLDTFTAFISNGGQCLPRLIHHLWERLIEHGLILHNGLWQSNVLVTHQIMPSLVAYHLRCDTFDNLFYPPNRLLSRYENSLVAIDVRKAGDEYRGTGFVLQHADKSFLVTCRHNVDPGAGISIKKITTAGGTSIPYTPFSLHPTLDIAVLRLESNVIGPAFRASDVEAEVFQEVFTIGYPNVPQADSTLVGHRGEVNGRTTFYLDGSPALLVSNMMAPGNSGGPVLDGTGRCVGMAFRSAEAMYQDSEPVRFSAALPISFVSAFVETA